MSINTKDHKFIQSIKDEVAINLHELGWCKKSTEQDGKYCLIGMLRGVILDSVSEHTAELGELEMDTQEQEWYREVLKDLCHRLDLPVNYESMENMRNALCKYNDGVDSLDEILTCLR